MQKHLHVGLVTEPRTKVLHFGHNGRGIRVMKLDRCHLYRVPNCFKRSPRRSNICRPLEGLQTNKS